MGFIDINIKNRGVFIHRTGRPRFIIIQATHPLGKSRDFEKAGNHAFGSHFAVKCRIFCAEGKIEMATVTPSKSRRSTRTEEETPSTSGVTSPGRRTRAASPARITRQEEKTQLQNLNDRLAAYIDRIRNLETENNRLLVQVRSTEETVSREVSSVKSMYENELEDARRVLDDTAKEKARLQIENGKLKADADEWKSK